MKTTIFSIIIPVYNVEKYIGHCLRSICNQDFDRALFEIIVVDDCSSDSSCSIIENVIKEYPTTNIRLLHHEQNKRQGGGRNTGLKVAQGEYILWVDSDDCLIYVNTLYTLQTILANRNIDILRAKTYTGISSDNFEAFTHAAFNGTITTYTPHEYFHLPHVGLHVHSAVYRRQFLLDHHIWFREHHCYEDSDWSYVVNSYAQEICEIDYPFYGYRHREDSTTLKVSVNTFMDNAISVVESEKAIAQYIKDPILQGDVRHWIKVSLYSFIKISRLYPVKDSRRVISYAYHNADFDLSRYMDTLKDYVVFNILKFAPIFILLPIRMLYSLKCSWR
jgi:glycosyltransferase involved in cell wall biosynthesis